MKKIYPLLRGFGSVTAILGLLAAVGLFWNYNYGSDSREGVNSFMVNFQLEDFKKRIDATSMTSDAKAIAETEFRRYLAHREGTTAFVVNSALIGTATGVSLFGAFLLLWARTGELRLILIEGRKEPNQPPEPTRPFGPSGSS